MVPWNFKHGDRPNKSRYTTKDKRDQYWWCDTQRQDGESIYESEKRRLRALDRDHKLAPIRAYRQTEEYRVRLEQWKQLPRAKGCHTEKAWYIDEKGRDRFWVWLPEKMTYVGWSYEEIGTIASQRNIVIRTNNPFLGFDYLPGQGYPWGSGTCFEAFLMDHPNFAFQYYKNLSDVPDYGGWKLTLTNTTYHDQWVSDQMKNWSPQDKLQDLNHEIGMYYTHILPKLQ